MLAVLPFENLTGDANQEYLSDGFTDEMIARLGSMDPQRLAVIARTSVMHYKNSRVPLNQIAGNLGVQYVLEGSVRSDSKHVRITVRLIQAKDQTHVWAKEYDHEPEDLLAVQSEIARTIANEIRLALGIAESTRRLGKEVLVVLEAFCRGILVTHSHKQHRKLLLSCASGLRE